MVLLANLGKTSNFFEIGVLYLSMVSLLVPELYKGDNFFSTYPLSGIGLCEKIFLSLLDWLAYSFLQSISCLTFPCFSSC